jgi:TonB family protein
MSGAIQWTMAKSRTRASSLAVVAAWLLTAVAVAEDGVEQVDSDTDRVPRHTVIPEYPEVARRDRIEGEVQACFEISRDGHPQRIAVRRSTNRLFEKPARKAVRKSTWVPLERDQESSGIKACRTFRFSLVPVDEDPVQS